jgi:hypothetical protein
LVFFLPKIVQSPEKVSFPTHTQKTLQTRKESRKPRPRGKFAKVKIKIKKRTQNKNHDVFFRRLVILSSSTHTVQSGF